MAGLAKAISERGADYVLCVKNNYPEAVEHFLLAQISLDRVFTASTAAESDYDGQVRTEMRHRWTLNTAERLYKADQ